MIKPVCFFDLETTGTDVLNDRIVEIAIVKKFFDEESEFHSLVNPEMLIPKAASDVHGITDEQVANSPKLIEIVPAIIGMISGCDLAGYNSISYDIPLLYNEFLRVGHHLDLTDVLFFDAFTVFKRREGRTLSDAVKFYTGGEHKDAHGAMADVRATIDVFKAQRNRYDDFPKNREELARYSNYDRQRADVSRKFSIDKDGDYIFAFGKHQDKKAKTEPDYLRWIIEKDFPPDTKELAKTILDTMAREDPDKRE